MQVSKIRRERGTKTDFRRKKRGKDQVLTAREIAKGPDLSRRDCLMDRSSGNPLAEGNRYRYKRKGEKGFGSSKPLRERENTTKTKTTTLGEEKLTIPREISKSNKAAKNHYQGRKNIAAVGKRKGSNPGNQNQISDSQKANGKKRVGHPMESP